MSILDNSISDQKGSPNYAIAPLVLGGLLAGGGSVIGSAISGISGAKAQESSNQTNMAIAKMNNLYNERMTNQQNAWNLDQWNRENEYNSAASQLQRYKDAGLNPNLIYGAGSAGGNQASSLTSAVPKAAESVRVQPVNYFEGVARGMSEAISSFIQMKNLDLNEKRAINDTRRTGSNVDLNTARQNLLAAQTISEQLRPDLIEKQIQNLDVKTIREGFQTGILRDQAKYSDEYYSNQVKAQAVAMALSDAQIQALSAKVAQGWKSLSIQDRSVSVQERMEAPRVDQIREAIDYMKKGGELREMEQWFKDRGKRYFDAQQLFGILGSLASGYKNIK